MGNIAKARSCFQESLNQKLNFSACLELAELEAAENNLERARNLLKNRLAILPLTRSEKEEREKLKERIKALALRLDIVYP